MLPKKAWTLLSRRKKDGDAAAHSFPSDAGQSGGDEADDGSSCCGEVEKTAKGDRASLDATTSGGGTTTGHVKPVANSSGRDNYLYSSESRGGSECGGGSGGDTVSGGEITAHHVHRAAIPASKTLGVGSGQSTDGAEHGLEKAKRCRGRSPARSRTRGGDRGAASLSPRIREPRHARSPETAYRNAVQAYRGIRSSDDRGRDTARSTTGRKQIRSLSPKTRSKWCSPVRPADAPSAVPSGGKTKRNEGKPPLLLSPPDWGIGLGGEWASVNEPRAIRDAGLVSLTWTDIRGNTLLHLAAQQNDIALIQTVLKCEARRKAALKTRDGRKKRVADRARQWAERSEKEATTKRMHSAGHTLNSKEISLRIKKQRDEEEHTARVRSGACLDREGATNEQEAGTVAADVDACREWLPLDAGALRHSRGRGAAIVQDLRAVLEEAHVRKVARLAGMYILEKINEADWYHRTGVLLPADSAGDILVDIAAAHPVNNFGQKMAKGAIQDYAEEERSKVGYWMDKGIKDALDLNAHNRLGETPLILAAQHGSLECVAALTEEAGLIVAAVNGENATALILAAMLEKTEVAKVLIAAYVARGVGVDHQTASGYTALHWAVVRGNEDITIDLVDAGGSLNTRRTEGTKALCRLPIHKCAEYGSEDCLQVLLKAGADPRLEDKLGMTAMHIAAGKGFLKIMQNLLSWPPEGSPVVGVNILSKKNGKSPLHYAVEHLQLDAAQLILDSAEGPDKAIKLLDGSQRTKLEMMLAAAEMEKRGPAAAGVATFSEFVRKVFL